MSVDIFNIESWKHLIRPYEDLTQEEQDQAFCHHAATGGDMLFLTTGEVICV